MNLFYVFLGGCAVLLGLGLLWSAIRAGNIGERPGATAKLIGGMMLAAFGLVLAGFAIGYAETDPLNYAEPAR